MNLRRLTPLELRVLGTLAEKQHTVPDSYPLSLNTLTLGCNQKTAREPVMNASEDEVREALDALRALSLVVEVSGSRVSRYEHNLGRVLALPAASVALLTLLCLRGPQTSAELRSHAERLHRFADISSVDGFLEELAARSPERGGPLAVKLPRAPGAREARWAQLLGGPVDVAALAAASATAAQASGVSIAELSSLKAEIDRQREELAALRSLVHRLAIGLGVDPQAGDAA